MKLQSAVAAGVQWTTLSSVLSGSSDIARAVVLARFLTPADFGMVAMVTIVTGFAQMYMDFGISGAIIHRQDTTKSELSSLYWLNIMVGLFTFGLVWLATPWIPLLFREPRILPFLKVMTVVFLIVPIGSQFEVLLQKELSFGVLARWEIAASLTGTATAIACAVAGLGAWSLVCGFLAGATLKTFLLATVGFTRFQPSMRFRRADLKGYVGFGLFQMGERSVNYIAERLDQMLIGSLLGAQALGFYNFALNLTAQPLSRINPILTKVAFPLFSKVQHDHQSLRKGYLKLINIIAMVNAPLLIGLAAVAPEAVPAIFGDKWSSSIILIQILCFVSLSRSLGNPIGCLQLAKGRADIGFVWNVVLLLCSIPVIYLGRATGDLIGIATALLLLHICLNIPAYLMLVRPLIGACGRDYAQVTLQPALLACVMGLAVIAMDRSLTGLSTELNLAARIATGGLVYAALILTFSRPAAQEVQWLLSARRSAEVAATPSGS